MQFVWEEQLSRAYFAGETRDSLQSCSERRSTWKASDLLYQIVLHLRMRLYGLGAPIYMCKPCCWWLSEIQLFTFIWCNSFLFFLLCLFVSYSIRFLTFYVKFLTAISHCLFSFVYFADSELTSSAGSSTVLCAVWIMESSRKNRTQVCLLFYIVVLLKIDCVILIIMWHYLRHSQGESFKICIKDLTYFIYYLIICCYWLGLVGVVCFGVICCSELMSAGQTLLALRLWPGLILTLLMVSQWIKTQAGTALYLTPSPQNHIGDTLSLQMSSLTSSWKVRVCECFCLCVFVCVSTLQQRDCRVHSGGKVVVIFFHSFFCQLWVQIDSSELLHRTQRLTFCSLMPSSISIFLLQQFLWSYRQDSHVCIHHVAETFFFQCNVSAPCIRSGNVGVWQKE